MATTSTPPLDMEKLNAFVGQAVGDLGAALHAALIVIGDRLGLYRAMLTASLSARPNWRKRRAHRSDTSGNG